MYLQHSGFLTLFTTLAVVLYTVGGETEQQKSIFCSSAYLFRRLKQTKKKCREILFPLVFVLCELLSLRISFMDILFLFFSVHLSFFYHSSCWSFTSDFVYCEFFPLWNADETQRQRWLMGQSQKDKNFQWQYDTVTIQSTEPHKMKLLCSKFIIA